MTSNEIIAEVRSIERRCRGPLPTPARRVVSALLQEGREEDAKRADAAGRPGCGYDFNRIILAGPLDGKQHTYECPGCGATGTYTAPWFPEPEAEE